MLKQFLIESYYNKILDIGIEDFDLLLSNLHDSMIVKTKFNNFIKVYKRDGQYYFSRYISEDEDITTYSELQISVYNQPIRSLIKAIESFKDKLNLIDNRHIIFEYVYDFSDITINMFNKAWYISSDEYIKIPSHVNIKIETLDVNGNIQESAEFWKFDDSQEFKINDEQLQEFIKDYRKWQNEKIDGKTKQELYHLNLNSVEKEIRLYMKKVKMQAYDEHKEFVRKFSMLLPDEYFIDSFGMFFDSKYSKETDIVKKFYGSIYSTDKTEDLYAQGGYRGQLLADISETIFNDRKLAKKSYYIKNSNTIKKEKLEKKQVQDILKYYYNILIKEQNELNSNIEKIACSEVINWILSLNEKLYKINTTTDLANIIYERYKNDN